MIEVETKNIFLYRAQNRAQLLVCMKPNDPICNKILQLVIDLERHDKLDFQGIRVNWDELVSICKPPSNINPHTVFCMKSGYTVGTIENPDRCIFEKFFHKCNEISSAIKSKKTQNLKESPLTEAEIFKHNIKLMIPGSLVYQFIKEPGVRSNDDSINQNLNIQQSTSISQSKTKKPRKRRTRKVKEKKIIDVTETISKNHSKTSNRRKYKKSSLDDSEKEIVKQTNPEVKRSNDRKRKSNTTKERVVREKKIKQSSNSFEILKYSIEKISKTESGIKRKYTSRKLKSLNNKQVYPEPNVSISDKNTFIHRSDTNIQSKINIKFQLSLIAPSPPKPSSLHEEKQKILLQYISGSSPKNMLNNTKYLNILPQDTLVSYDYNNLNQYQPQYQIPINQKTHSFPIKAKKTSRFRSFLPKPDENEVTIPQLPTDKSPNSYVNINEKSIIDMGQFKKYTILNNARNPHVTTNLYRHDTLGHKARYLSAKEKFLSSFVPVSYNELPSEIYSKYLKKLSPENEI